MPITTTVVELYLSSLKEQRYSISHRTRVKTVINGFCQWLLKKRAVPYMTTSSMAGVSTRVPTSLRPSSRLTEDGIHQWFGGLNRHPYVMFVLDSGCRYDVPKMRETLSYTLEV